MILLPDSGYVYAIRFFPFYWHATAYLGSTDDIWRRWYQHLSGGDCANPLVTAAHQSGRLLELLVLEMDSEKASRQLEAKYKRRNNNKIVVPNMLKRGAKVLARAWNLRTCEAIDHFATQGVDADLRDRMREIGMKQPPDKRLVFETRFLNAEVSWEMLINGHTVNLGGTYAYPDGVPFPTLNTPHLIAHQV